MLFMPSDYHRFRRFDKKPPAEAGAAKTTKKADAKPKADSDAQMEDITEKFVSVEYSEIDKMLSMKVKDYVAYLRRRGVALATVTSTTPEEDKAALSKFSFLVSDDFG